MVESAVSMHVKAEMRSRSKAHFLQLLCQRKTSWTHSCLAEVAASVDMDGYNMALMNRLLKSRR